MPGPSAVAAAPATVVTAAVTANASVAATPATATAIIDEDVVGVAAADVVDGVSAEVGAVDVGVPGANISGPDVATAGQARPITTRARPVITTGPTRPVAAATRPVATTGQARSVATTGQARSVATTGQARSVTTTAGDRPPFSIPTAAGTVTSAQTRQWRGERARSVSPSGAGPVAAARETRQWRGERARSVLSPATGAVATGTARQGSGPVRPAPWGCRGPVHVAGVWSVHVAGVWPVHAHVPGIGAGRVAWRGRAGHTTATGARHPTAAPHGGATGVSAVVLNVTVTNPQASGYVTVYGDGDPKPSTSNVNFRAGRTVPNLVIAPVGADGRVDLYNGSTAMADLLADVAGYFVGAWTAFDAPSLSTLGGTPQTSLQAVTCPAADACTAVGSYTAGGNYAAIVDTFAAGTWTPNQLHLPANAGDVNDLPNSTLAGVPCPTTTWCEAVGFYTDTSNSVDGLSETLIDGTWVPTELPDRLVDIACKAVDSCVAFGYYQDQTFHPHDTVAILSGDHWSVGLPPVPSDAAAAPDAVVSSAACDGASCYLVGDYTTTSGTVVPLVDKWTDGSLTTTSPTVPSDIASTYATLSGIACPAAGACEAVGTYSDGGTNTAGLIESLSDGSWTATRAPNPAGIPSSAVVNMTGIACPSVGTCQAIGGWGYYDQAESEQVDFGFVDAQNQDAWTATQLPFPPNSESPPVISTLAAISCSAPGSCTAVGNYGAGTLYDYGLLDSLADGQWSTTRAPQTANSQSSSRDDRVTAVSCPSTPHCIALDGTVIESK